MLAPHNAPTIALACAEVHRLALNLPRFAAPTEVPFTDGLYLFYEASESSPHALGGRIVRVGNHPRRDGRLVGRLREHYRTRRDAKNSSVFRLLLGGALLRRDDPGSLCLAPAPGQGHWEKQMQHECDRCAEYEVRVSAELQGCFHFRCIRITDRTERNFFEARLVATLAACGMCTPSPDWLGWYAPSSVIHRCGLWNREFVGGPTLTVTELGRFAELVGATPQS